MTTTNATDAIQPNQATEAVQTGEARSASSASQSREVASTAPLAPFRLEPVFSERIWGRDNLQPWYASTGTDQPVGEAWLTGPACRIATGPLTGKTLAEAVAEHSNEILAASPIGDLAAGPTSTSAEFPLLIKLLFPNEKLSVQVHPDDTEAASMGLARGKTECWYVLEAIPGATVALGLKPGVTREALAAAATDSTSGANGTNGTMEQLIEQLPVSVGDMIYVDAGTVHAIGPGVVLLETQQTSDITFRLYDYGRPRELHLEQGLRVVKPITAAGKVAPRTHTTPAGSFQRLIDQRYFVVDRFEAAPGQILALEDPSDPISIKASACIVTLSGSGSLSTDAGSVALEAAEAVVVPANSTGIQIEATTDLVFVRCFEPRPGTTPNP